jgi:2-oxoisovalerate dehydrogenase E1 component alpha subunit
MQNAGEEASQIGSSAALDNGDVIFSQYREVGTLLWRGFTLQQCADQCFATVDDQSKGRQMPVHYGSAEHNFQTISSPLATQIPQAAGAAYALKLAKKDNVAIVYFGDGAASEGDFHAGMNIAATRECPIIFFCRNNGYAISTPIADQFRGDGIISRAAGYGMRSVRVDGNDVFAVYQATEEARRVALEHNCPVLIEAMTYRKGHHSTSDDSTKYRSIEEIKDWETFNDPMRRFRNYLSDQGMWTEEWESQLREEERAAVMTALETSEVKAHPSIENLFEDVYDVMPAHIAQQMKDLKRHVALHEEHYEKKH